MRDEGTLADPSRAKSGTVFASCRSWGISRLKSHIYHEFLPPSRGFFYCIIYIRLPRSSLLLFLPLLVEIYIHSCVPTSHLEYNNRIPSPLTSSLYHLYTRDSRDPPKLPLWLQTRWQLRLRIWPRRTQLSLLRLPPLSSGGRIRDGGKPRGRSLLSKSWRRGAQSRSTTPATTSRKSSGTSSSKDSRYVAIFYVGARRKCGMLTCDS